MHSRVFLLAVSVFASPLLAEETYKVEAPPSEIVQRLQLAPFYKSLVRVSGFPSSPLRMCQTRANAGSSMDHPS